MTQVGEASYLSQKSLGPGLRRGDGQKNTLNTYELCPYGV